MEPILGCSKILKAFLKFKQTKKINIHCVTSLIIYVLNYSKLRLLQSISQHFYNPT
jgi:hypothetical protein